MKRIFTLVTLLAMLAVSAAPAGGGALTDYFFGTTQVKLAPAKACTTDAKHYGTNTKNTFQIAVWAHSGDTCVLGINQLPSNFAGTGSFKIANVNVQVDTALFVDTIFGNGAWQYGKIYTWDSLTVALNTKFKVLNKHAHDTIDSFQISHGNR
jgi:hypothetical protein